MEQNETRERGRVWGATPNVGVSVSFESPSLGEIQIRDDVCMHGDLPIPPATTTASFFELLSWSPPPLEGSSAVVALNSFFSNPMSWLRHRDAQKSKEPMMKKGEG